MGRIQQYTIPIDGTPVPIAVKGATVFSFDAMFLELAYQVADFDNNQFFRMNGAIPPSTPMTVVYQLGEGTQLFARQDVATAVADITLYVWTLIGSGGQ